MPPTSALGVARSPDAYRLPPIPGSAYLKVTDSAPERFRVAHVSWPHLWAAQGGAQALLPPMEIAPFRLRERSGEGSSMLPAYFVMPPLCRLHLAARAIARRVSTRSSKNQKLFTNSDILVKLRETTLGEMPFGWLAGGHRGRGGRR